MNKRERRGNDQKSIGGVFQRARKKNRRSGGRK